MAFVKLSKLNVALNTQIMFQSSYVLRKFEEDLIKNQ